MTLEQLYGFWLALAPLTKLAVVSGALQALGYIAYGWYVAWGKIVADGTHDDLLKHEGGLYHKLWSIQAGSFITDDTE